MLHANSGDIDPTRSRQRGEMPRKTGAVKTVKLRSGRDRREVSNKGSRGEGHHNGDRAANHRRSRHSIIGFGNPGIHVPVMCLKILQINVGRSRAAHDMAFLVVGEEDAVIIIASVSGKWLSDGRQDVAAY